MDFMPTIVDLSPSTYLIVFAIGAAVLAMWIHMRFPTRGPDSVPMIVTHMAAAVLGGQLIVPAALRSAGSDEQVLAVTIAVVLPLVVYMLLSAIWLIRFGQGLLRRYSNN